MRWPGPQAERGPKPIHVYIQIPCTYLSGIRNVDLFPFRSVVRPSNSQSGDRDSTAASPPVTRPNSTTPKSQLSRRRCHREDQGTTAPAGQASRRAGRRQQEPGVLPAAACVIDQAQDKKTESPITRASRVQSRSNRSPNSSSRLWILFQYSRLVFEYLCGHIFFWFKCYSRIYGFYLKNWKFFKNKVVENYWDLLCHKND